MTKVYLDCDGVILDTINKSYQIFKDKGIKTEEERKEFYSNISWKKLIIESGEINNSISKIKELLKYFDIEILTHIYTDNELKEKINYFGIVLPGVNVIGVPKTIEKADFIDPTNAVLVDDFTHNLDYWKEKGGISIKFSSSDKECAYPIISDLSNLIELLNKNKVKVEE